MSTEDSELGNVGKSYGVQQQQQQAQDAPPADPSLMGRVKSAKTESSGTFDYFKKLSIILMGTAGCSICLAIYLVLPIASIAIGSIYLDDCPKERYIPIYLIVAGVFGVLLNLTNLIWRCKTPKKDAEGNPKVQANPLDGLISTFVFAWFIAGNVWVYRIHKKFTTEDPSAADYCHPTVYWFAFWTITLVYIMIALSCCCFCCCGILCAKAAVKEHQKHSNQSGHENYGSKY